MSITVAMYSHDSVGLGHARRNRALAFALAADLPRITGERVRGLLVAGHPGATADALPDGWDWLVLPGFTATASGYTSRSLDVSSERLWHLRSSTAAAALEAMNPDLFIVDRHPFGVDNELLPALEALRGAGTRCVLGMRDVLDRPEVASQEWTGLGGAAGVAHYYSALWIYGDRGVHDPLATGEIPPELSSMTTFTGFLSHGRPDDPLNAAVPTTEPYVLTMVGGGSDGKSVALAATQAHIPAGHRHLILTGPQMPPADHQQILDAVHHSPTAPDRVHITRYAPYVPHLVRDASAVISMGGYNSLAEIMATATPALIVPRSSRRQEQRIRARALAAVQAVDTITPEHLSSEALSAWLTSSVGQRCQRDALDLDGLTRLGDIAALELAAGKKLKRPSESPADSTLEPTATIDALPH
ncbi:glycosyl transferase [Nesterenkonia salmonea]|uniref:Glycosyl transferase n=1 Tax=Nesterenkonia salmonea TaxID=1804987 RepID=A0A5R9BJI1_9MICC|nr:glycosyltransferase [Nesterenkonia salmonea]TLQ00293.1 glycosyl transferase [Nesterenkonia salmonea]